ncbi:MAG TPA: hypothetical protein VEL28_22570 [Candidatus Binatia bacterium]|nr:hypothetical protein [Candidatus Binatia bacterium]
MAFHSMGKSLSVAAFAAAYVFVSAPAHAAEPGVVCAQAVAKSVAKCAKKAATTHAKCFKATGAACLDNNESLVKTAGTAGKIIRAKCASNAEVIAAGYGPSTYIDLGTHFGDTCLVQGKVLVDRAFGAGGDNYAAADDDEKKCISGALKEASKVFTSALGIHAKCVGASCDTATTNAAIDEVAGEAEAKIGDKCDLNAAIGVTPTAFIDGVVEQVPSAVAAPCDPLDTDRCAFPFPNDYYTVSGAGSDSGRQVALGRTTLPANDSDKDVITTKWNAADGWSIGPMLLMNDASIDLAVTGAAPITDMAQSLEADAPVVLIDAESGEKQLIWVERDLRGATAADQPIIIRVGRNLKNSHRYIVAMRNMKNSAGTVLSPSSGFAIYRDATPTDLLPVELRRPHMEEMFTRLGDAGIARNDLYLAWDFTTQSEDSTAGKLLAMRDDSFAALGTAAPSFTVNTVTEGENAQVFRRIDGTFQVPLYINNALLDTNNVVGSTLKVDGNGRPVSDGTYTASFRCIVPNAANNAGTAVPARPSLYGHGLLGSHTEVTAGNVRSMSNEHNFVFCATDWTGFADDDANTAISVVGNFTHFPTFIDRQHQGLLNFMYLGRLLIHANGFSSHTAFQVGGQSMIDTSELFYDGNSQGGILGGVLAAFSQDATRFSLGVPGINYSTLLHRSVDFIIFDDLQQDAYPSSTDRNLLLSAAQVIWDRIDPSGHVTHTLADTYPNTPAKKILYQVAFGDHQVAPVTIEVAARSNGANIHTPVVDPLKPLPDVTPYYDVTPIPAYPFDGSAVVIWDSGNPAPPIGNVPPEEISPSDPEYADLEACVSDDSGDPHSCPRSDPDARIQKSEFLKTGGAVVDVCGGQPCKAQ